MVRPFSHSTRAKCRLPELFYLFVLVCCLVDQLDAISLRGNNPWSLLLCKYHGNNYEPHDVDYYRSWLLDRSRNGSIAGYFAQVSNGLYTIAHSNVHEWFTIPYTMQDVYFLSNHNIRLVAKYTDTKQRMFHMTKVLCAESARKRSNKRVYPSMIVVINDENIALYCGNDGVLLSPQYIFTSAAAHEMTHSFNIGHSFSDRNVIIYPYSVPGEYDDVYDLMSTSNAQMHPSDFGNSGPGLIAPHLEYLGWLPSDRMLTIGQDGRLFQHIAIATLSRLHSSTTGPLLVRIPYDREEPFNYFTVEFRIRESIDGGMEPQAALVIHKLLRQSSGYLFSYLVTNVGGRHEWLPGEQFTTTFGLHDSDFVRIFFESVDIGAGTASIAITSSFDPLECSIDEVEREITGDDKTCISASDKVEILEMKKSAKNNLNHSTQACHTGFIYRKAFPGDRICVQPYQKDMIAHQNDRWSKYKRFYHYASPGLNGCKDGFVWRQIDKYDYACVTSSHVNVLKQQELLHSSRSNQDGSCKSGFTHRSTFSTDRTCVTVSEAEKARQESWFSQWNMKYRRFFNGIDSVR